MFPQLVSQVVLDAEVRGTRPPRISAFVSSARSAVTSLPILEVGFFLVMIGLAA